jgi:DNA-3-methyladenine glycosylase II
LGATSIKRGEFLIDLPYPIDPAGSLEMFRRSGDDLLDRWDGCTFIRTILAKGQPIAFATSFERGRNGLAARVVLERPRDREAVEPVVRAMFVTPPAEYPELRRRDRLVDALERAYPGVRSVRQANLFGALVRCVTTQQVNLRWAATCRRRMAEAFGRIHRVGGAEVYSLEPERIAELDPAQIRALQITTRKAEYIVNLARIIAHGDLTMEALAQASDEDVIARLSAIRGIGLWTAEWILARSLGRPRVVAGDLGVRKAIGIGYRNGARPSEAEVRGATAHWGASAGVAQALILHALAEKRLASLAAQAGARRHAPAEA